MSTIIVIDVTRILGTNEYYIRASDNHCWIVQGHGNEPKIRTEVDCPTCAEMAERVKHGQQFILAEAKSKLHGIVVSWGDQEAIYRTIDKLIVDLGGNADDLMTLLNREQKKIEDALQAEIDVLTSKLQIAEGHFTDVPEALAKARRVALEEVQRRLIKGTYYSDVDYENLIEELLEAK